MNIIASLARGEPKKAAATIEGMAVLPRLRRSQDENFVPVKNQVDGRWREGNGRIHIRATNPIPKVRARQAKPTPGQSLDKIRQQFQNHYSGQASLISVEEDSRLTVTVVLPTRGGNP